MEKRLLRYAEIYSCLWRSCGTMSELYTSEVNSIFCELHTAHQLFFFAQLVVYSFLFHFIGAFQLFCYCLFREAFLICPFYGIVNIKNVFHYKNSVQRKKFGKRDFFRLCLVQFRDNIYNSLLLFRQLTLHFNNAEGINLITKKIYTVWIFATEREYIYDTASYGILSRFIDIVFLLESESFEGVFDEFDIYFLAYV